MWDSCAMATALLTELCACQRCLGMEVFLVQSFQQHTDKASLMLCTFRDSFSARTTCSLPWSLTSAKFEIVLHESLALSNSTSGCTGFNRGSFLQLWSSWVATKGARDGQRERCSLRHKNLTRLPDWKRNCRIRLRKEGWITAGIKTLGKKEGQTEAEWVCGLIKNQDTDSGNVSRRKMMCFCTDSEELGILVKITLGKLYDRDHKHKLQYAPECLQAASGSLPGSRGSRAAMPCLQLCPGPLMCVMLPPVQNRERQGCSETREAEGWVLPPCGTAASHVRACSEHTCVQEGTGEMEWEKPQTGCFQRSETMKYMGVFILSRKHSRLGKKTYWNVSRIRTNTGIQNKSRGEIADLMHLHSPCVLVHIKAWIEIQFFYMAKSWLRLEWLFGCTSYSFIPTLSYTCITEGIIYLPNWTIQIN